MLDSFTGSGTTGRAVLKMNAAAKDTEPRRFLLVEMDGKIAPEITRERVKLVTEGYTNAKGEKVPGLGGGFRYVRLGDHFSMARLTREGLTFKQTPYAIRTR